MLIKEIKQEKNFLFLKSGVVVLTDGSKISLKVDWDSDTLNKLNSSLKDFKIECPDDFTKLKNELKWLDASKYSALELSLFNSLPNFLKFFNSNLKEVPRPMSVILKRDIGIKQFLIFSLNSNNFEAALIANRHVSDFIAKKIQDTANLKEEDVLMLIKEAIDEEHSLIDFELRVGVIFNNFSSGTYRYLNKELDPNEQFEFVSKLIEKYGVCYVENAFTESDLLSYKKLSDKYRSKCLISLNSSINEYNLGINKRAFNTLIIKFVDLSTFTSEVSFFKENNLNIIFEDNVGIEVAAALGVPLVKLEDNEEGNRVSKKLLKIVEKLKEN